MPGDPAGPSVALLARGIFFFFFGARRGGDSHRFREVSITPPIVEQSDSPGLTVPLLLASPRPSGISALPQNTRGPTLFHFVFVGCFNESLGAHKNSGRCVAGFVVAHCIFSRFYHASVSFFFSAKCSLALHTFRRVVRGSFFSPSTRIGD